jgi:hypothetical protein
MMIPIVGSSELPIIGEKRCSRKWVNKREGPKFVPMKHSKGFRLRLTENWAQKWFRKMAYLQRLMSHSRGISKNFTLHKKKKTLSQYRSLGQLTVYSVITSNNLICLMSYILKHRAQHLLVWNNIPPQIRKPTHNRWLSPTLIVKVMIPDEF